MTLCAGDDIVCRVMTTPIKVLPMSPIHKLPKGEGVIEDSRSEKGGVIVRLLSEWEQ
jgi:hypothetical protein